MARIKDSSVEAVKSAAEIVPLVEDYVRLRKAGGTYKGLCPFASRSSKMRRIVAWISSCSWRR